MTTTSISVAEFAEKAYLNYSMYVILDRALPQVADGLKPVQRRIVYAMSELGLRASAKPKKSARTVGDVLGKFHPHGDSACYEAMVLMAQDFNYRYPLIDGQGNWGSPNDPKSFAAMRYTEAKLAPYAQIFLSELELGTVDYTANFDATLEEPKLLPARLPNILLNGTSGIAVALSTDIPSHNMREVVRACIHLLKHPEATQAKILSFIKGPDLPTGARIITSPSEFKKIYASGVGSYRQRACWQEQQDSIEITALPHQISSAKVMEEIAEQMKLKKLPMVVDIRDESDQDQPILIVLDLRSGNIDKAALMRHLCATTSLEKSFRINMNAIGTDGRPTTFPLIALLKQWLEFRLATVHRRTDFQIQRIEERIHILEGLLTAFLNIDEVIKIIRNHDHPKTALMERFALSDIQAEAILQTRLRQLARLEEIKIKGELLKLQQQSLELHQIIATPESLANQVSKELQEDSDTYGDKRRSAIEPDSAAIAEQIPSLIPSENITIILSRNGWIRAAKGYEIDAENLYFRTGDALQQTAPGKTTDSLVILDSSGRCYSLSIHNLPSARRIGEPLSSLLQPPSGVSFKGMFFGQDTDRYLLSHSAGLGFITCIGQMASRPRSGKACITLPTGAEILPPCRINDSNEQLVAMISRQGRLLIIAANEIAQLRKGKGMKLMQILKKDFQESQDYLIQIVTLQPDDNIEITAGKQFIRLTAQIMQQDYLANRAGRGRLLPRGYREVTNIRVVNQDKNFPE